jgi:hypothetical protein
VSREAVAKGMRGGWLGDSGSLRGGFDRALQQTLVHMMTPHDARARIGRDIGGGEDELPAPFASGVGIFAIESLRQPDSASSIACGDTTCPGAVSSISRR